MLRLSTETAVDLSMSGARFGCGLFETIRVQNGKACWLGLHLERLAAGCAFLGLEAPPPLSEVEAFLDSKMALHTALRLLAVDDRLLAWCEAPPPLSGPATMALSRRVVRCSVDPLNRFKTLSYLPNLLLQREARERGLFEVIAPNERGHLTDGGRTSLLVCLDHRWWTPPLEDGALPGIGRRVLLEAGLIQERSLVWEDLESASGLALVNALRGVRAVERRAGPWTGPGPGMDKLMARLDPNSSSGTPCRP